MDKLEIALARMEERTKYVQEHQERTQAIFSLWAEVSDRNGEDWPNIANKVKDTIDWLFENRSQFPNYLTHHEQWSALFQIAKRRSFVREFMQRCTGNPDYCHEVGDCFNLQHMIGGYVFESAEPVYGICRVTMRDTQ